MIRVLVDTREQLPYLFHGQAKLGRAALPEGDYRLAGDKLGLVIERKSKEDLFGTLSKGLARFEKELSRLERYDYPVLLVECLPRDIAVGAHFSQANGHRVLQHTFEACVKHSICLMFAENRHHAEQTAYSLLAARAEMRKKHAA